MPLTSAKCTNCGSNLEIDNTKDAAICPYCGTPYVVEKAINYYNTTNNINAEVVNIYGGGSADFEIRAGELIKYNGSVTEVVIPNNVTMIGREAFYNCRGLTSVLIPDSVTSIGDKAFSCCSSLTEITLPDSITYIGFNVFNNCISLTNVKFPKGITVIPGSMFSHCSSLTTIEIPRSITEIQEKAFEYSGLKKIVIPGNVTKIGRDAFSYCKNLSEVTFGFGLKEIGESTFYRSGLIYVTIPDSVEEVGEEAFFECDNLKQVVLPANPLPLPLSYDRIPFRSDYCFSRCKNLTTVINGENFSYNWLIRCFNGTPYADNLPDPKKSSNSIFGGLFKKR